MLDSNGICVGSSAYLHTTKKHLTVDFDDLAHSVQHPRFVNIFDSEAKSDAPFLLHALFVAINSFGHLPHNSEEL